MVPVHRDGVSRFSQFAELPFPMFQPFRGDRNRAVTGLVLVHRKDRFSKYFSHAPNRGGYLVGFKIKPFMELPTVSIVSEIDRNFYSIFVRALLNQ